MKPINEFLSTKVNANVSYERTVKTILRYFLFDEFYAYYKKAYDCISSWCKENKVITVTPCCDIECFEIIKDNAKQYDINVNDYDITTNSNEICQDELSKVKLSDQVAIEHSKSNNVDIWYTENMIACISTFGTIYCWNKNI